MALGTGNTLILKPAEDAPLAVLKIAELAADIFPAGVFNIVTGSGIEAGAPLFRLTKTSLRFRSPGRLK